jgi:hypothetical protein
MPSHFPRLLYALEFLLAVVSILELWSQAGGQGHLDMIPWYAKLGFTLGLAAATVMATVSAVAHERAWNAKTIACLVLAFILAGGMAAATYYAHVHENDDADSEAEDVTAVYWPPPRLMSWVASSWK